MTTYWTLNKINKCQQNLKCLTKRNKKLRFFSVND